MSPDHGPGAKVQRFQALRVCTAFGSAVPGGGPCRVTEPAGEDASATTFTPPSAQAVGAPERGSRRARLWRVVGKRALAVTMLYPTLSEAARGFHKGAG